MPPRKKGNEPENPATFIVRKKHSEDEGGHHGGVWKIAYADFMTAMMTFFLVMWLVNTSSKEKITRLASYFNPVRLTDNTAVKGLRDSDAGGTNDDKAAPAKPDKNGQKSGKKSEKKSEAEKKNEAEKRQPEDEALFRTPFSVLTELAAKAEGAMAAAMSESRAANSPGRASHDPFVTDPVISHPITRVAFVAEEPAARDAAARTPASAAPGANSSRPLEQQGRPSENKDAGSRAAPDASEPQPNDKTRDAAAQLAKELGRLMQALPKSFRPNITTKATSEGVLVSLTDDANFSMFKIASAEPLPQLVLVLERIGSLINKQPGKLVVRGHTDGRRYSGDAHGNWRLSLNRANMAYFMLLRAKVDDSRFLAVEGYADRNLRNKSDPLAAENRRIEILIKGVDS